MDYLNNVRSLRRYTRGWSCNPITAQEKVLTFKLGMYVLDFFTKPSFYRNGDKTIPARIIPIFWACFSHFAKLASWSQVLLRPLHGPIRVAYS